MEKKVGPKCPKCEGSVCLRCGAHVKDSTCQRCGHLTEAEFFASHGESLIEILSNLFEPLE